MVKVKSLSKKIHKKSNRKKEVIFLNLNKCFNFLGVTRYSKQTTGRSPLKAVSRVSGGSNWLITTIYINCGPNYCTCGIYRELLPQLCIF